MSGPLKAAACGAIVVVSDPSATKRCSASNPSENCGLARHGRLGSAGWMRAFVGFSLATWMVIASFSAPATPCGAFVARATKTVPSLAVEQTLILFDAKEELEHFVREIAIRDPSPGFGFVVPVPERPEVAKVKTNPFAKLAAKFPVSSGVSLAGTQKGGFGGGIAAARAVTVLSRERVGSFTAFVLAASDAKALEKWFSDNQLRVSPEAEAWLAQYVKLGFYFAALRYEIQEKDLKSTTARAETVRISFRTPLPFYPYREPAHATPSSLPRDLAVWLVSTQAYTPVSLFESVSTSQTAVSEWRRPLVEHASNAISRVALVSALSDELSQLLPSNVDRAGEGELPLRVQVFEDQKRSRAGFGDIVMVPQRPAPLTGVALARSRKLMASLDPAVVP